MHCKDKKPWRGARLCQREPKDCINKYLSKGCINKHIFKDIIIRHLSKGHENIFFKWWHEEISFQGLHQQRIFKDIIIWYLSKRHEKPNKYHITILTHFKTPQISQNVSNQMFVNISQMSPNWPLALYFF